MNHWQSEHIFRLNGPIGSVQVKWDALLNFEPNGLESHTGEKIIKNPMHWGSLSNSETVLKNFRNYLKFNFTTHLLSANSTQIKKIYYLTIIHIVRRGWSELLEQLQASLHMMWFVEDRCFCSVLRLWGVWVFFITNTSQMHHLCCLKWLNANLKMLLG